MALNVTKADEVIPVEQLCWTLYSQPGLGKTSLAFTASRPVLLDFDGGAYRAVDRKDTVRVSAWSDVADIKPADLEDYDTVILDTVGKALDFLADDIIRGNSRLGWGGALNQQGWGQLGVRFRGFLSSLKRHGKDIILVSHMDEKHDGDALKERLKIPGGSQALVLTDSDMIARISIANKQRQLIFSPTEASFGKDPAQIGFVDIPDASKPAFATFGADMIARTKAALNELSAAQVERKGEVEWFSQHLPGVKDADGINELLGRSKKAGNDVAKMVVDRAQAIGLEFDATTRQYKYLEDFRPGKDGEDEDHHDKLGSQRGERIADEASLEDTF